MHRVGSSGNTSNSVRPRKEKRLTYVLSDADDTKVGCVLVFGAYFYFFAFECECQAYLSFKIFWQVIIGLPV